MIVNRQGNRFEVLSGTVAFEDINGTYDTIEDVLDITLEIRADEEKATIDLDDHCVVRSEADVRRQVALLI